ncbi:hypothetical protein [Kitasatospora terrestris]|uniref:Integral membrane protein n=1 Tax=Kitasatospora terrestris TaxID=258051 RepID=A0ABP9EJ05_9ACTN
MKPDEARAALDDLQYRHRQTRAASARYGFSGANVLVAAVALFISFASFDLPNPWGGAVLFPAVGLLAVQLTVCLRRAPVRLPLGGRQAVLAAAAGVALVAVFRLLAGAAGAAGVPAPHAVAAAAVCLAGLVAAGRVRAAATVPGRAPAEPDPGTDGQ